MYMTKTVTRDSLPEVFRIILMGMIVFWHLILHGVPSYSTKPLLLILVTLAHVAVPCFVIISGWFGIKPNVKGFMRLISMVVGYSLLGWMFRLAFGAEVFSFNGLGRALFPLLFDRWWFIGVYLALYLTAPILNTFTRHSDIRSMWIAIATLYFVSFWLGCQSLFTQRLPLFWMLYLLGHVLHNPQRQKTLIERHPLVSYLCCAICTFIGTRVCIASGQVIGGYGLLFFKYNSPFVIMSSICLSLLFLGDKSKQHAKWRSPIVNYVAAAVFPCYLIHEHNFFTHDFYTWFGELNNRGGGGTIAILGILLSMVIFIACTCLDVMMRPIYSRAAESLSKLFSRYWTQADKVFFALGGAGFVCSLLWVF